MTWLLLSNGNVSVVDTSEHPFNIDIHIRWVKSYDMTTDRDGCVKKKTTQLNCTCD